MLSFYGLGTSKIHKKILALRLLELLSLLKAMFKPVLCIVELSKETNNLFFSLGRH